MEEISIIDIPSWNVLGMKQTGNYSLIPTLLFKLYEYAVTFNIPLAGPPAFICHETSPESVKEANEKGTAVVECVWPIRGPAQGGGAIWPYEVPGGKMVRILHKGPYDACEPTYLRLFTWMEERGLKVGRPIREVYLNDPHGIKPEEILMEIYVPVV